MRHAFVRRSIPLLTFTAVIGLGPIARSADPEAPAGARRPLEPATPELPAAIVAAMQEGRYAEADKALSALADAPKTSGEMKAYVAVIRGVALRLSGKLDAARELLSAALKAAPRGRWAAKTRSELAAVEVAAGKFAAAEALAREEAERLLAGDRKDRLAEVYRGFADRLLSPDLPTIPADPEGAYALLAQARSLAKGEALRASLLLAMARASQKAGNHARAIEDFQAYLSEYPKGADRTRGPLPPGRGPARRRPAPAGPPHLDRPGPRPREGRHRGRPPTSAPAPCTGSPGPTASPPRPTTPS